MPDPNHPIRLSPNFWLHELIVSQKATRLGIKNYPGPDELVNLGLLAESLEQVRAELGHVPVIVSSAFRSRRVNALSDGSRNSAHIQGLAADFTVPDFGTPLAICRRLARAENIQFDQLIFEGTWVHFARAAVGAKPRRQVLTAHFRKGQKTTYTPGLPL